MSWKQAVAEYRKPLLKRGIWQLVNTLVPYVVLWGAMVWSLSVSYWLTLGLALIAAGFLVRVFIIFHDCGHRSFFKSKRANDVLGFLTGVLLITPYQQWRHKHALHHATSGDLDRRGTGDIWTMTVDEYLAAPRMVRIRYRLLRNPFFLFILAPLYVFGIEYRFPARTDGPRARRGVYLTNLALLGIVVVASFTIGLEALVLVQLPIFMISSAVGFWLFYVQHQFEGVYWERRQDWSFVDAAIHGSSFYKLPKVLQWFSGSIGFHHVHHLSSAIPNYNLERCHEATPFFQEVKAITLFPSMKSFNYRLWDEKNKELIGYRRLRAIRKGEKTAVRS